MEASLYFGLISKIDKKASEVRWTVYLLNPNFVSYFILLKWPYQTNIFNFLFLKLTCITFTIILLYFQIWDPFTGDIVRQLESTKYSPVIALATLPCPSTVVVTATTDSTLR